MKKKVLATLVLATIVLILLTACNEEASPMAA